MKKLKLLQFYNKIIFIHNIKFNNKKYKLKNNIL